eukprot:7265314-Prymnesium_polylepis.1
MSIGENYTHRGQGYNAAARFTLTSKEAEVAYQNHPSHVDARDTIVKPLLIGETPVLAVDYEYAAGVQVHWCYQVGLGFACGFLLATALRVRSA